MKLILFASVLLTGSAFAYTTSTVGNHPPKDEVIKVETRKPASQSKDVKEPEKVKSSKVAAEK